jgi:hypothetical protein
MNGTPVRNFAMATDKPQHQSCQGKLAERQIGAGDRQVEKTLTRVAPEFRGRLKPTG